MQSHRGLWRDDRVHVRPTAINNHNCSEAWRLHELRTRKIAIGLNLYVNDVKALEWVYGKLSTRVALFCIFEIKTSNTLN